jgi:hypothetical protein
MGLLRAFGVLLLSAGLGGCLGPSAPREVPVLASAQVSADLGEHALGRVGLLPVQVPEAQPVDAAYQSAQLSAIFHGEFARATSFELLQLGPRELEAVAQGDPFRRGRYDPALLAELGRRFRLDALLLVNVGGQRVYAPQALSAQAELVSVSTGAVLWAGQVHLDAADPRVTTGLEVFYSDAIDGEVNGPWTLSLHSPERFARFGAWQLAQVF